MPEEVKEKKIVRKAKPKDAASASKPESKLQSKPSPNGYLAVIQIRGGIRAHVNMEHTLKMLNLNNQHNLVFLPNTPNMNGMLKVVKDYVTWGEVSPELKAEIESKKTELGKKGKPHKFFRLHPPIGGYERKGIKTAYSVGGALGYRGDKINDLIKKMLQ